MSRINSNAGMRPRRVRRLLALMASGAVLAGAGLGWGIGEAHDTPVDDYIADNAVVICALLDDNPTVSGVEAVGAALISKGLPPRVAGNVMARSVIGFCPEHLEELQLFIGKWSGRSVA